jgi:hypothetical protein
LKRIAPILALVAFIAAIVLWFFLRNDPRDNALDAREVATHRLAEYLAQNYPGQRALLVSNPFTENDATAKEIVATEKAGIAGVRKGLGGKVTLEAIAYPELKPEARANPRAVFIDGETTTPLSYLVADDSFDKLLAKHPNCDLMISLVGLPASLKETQCWQNEKPRFALLLPDLRFVGNAAAVKRAVQSGKLAAFVLPKPGAPDSRAPLKGPGDFDQRFILVTRENIDRVVADYPQLFPVK